jgi:putative acetyltransferase
MTELAALIRPEHSGDEQAIRDVHVHAFGRPEEADLVDALRASPAWVPELSLVATMAGGAVVGHALLSRLEVGGDSALALAPVAVLPSHQRRGIGTGLVRAALADASALGERLVVVLGDPGYYGRFGFGPASRLGVTGPYDVPDEVFQAVALPAYDGIPRGAARYPAAFAGL